MGSGGGGVDVTGCGTGTGWGVGGGAGGGDAAPPRSDAMSANHAPSMVRDLTAHQGREVKRASQTELSLPC